MHQNTCTCRFRIVSDLSSPTQPVLFDCKFHYLTSWREPLSIAGWLKDANKIIEAKKVLENYPLINWCSHGKSPCSWKIPSKLCFFHSYVSLLECKQASINSHQHQTLLLPCRLHLHLLQLRPPKGPRASCDLHPIICLSTTNHYNQQWNATRNINKRPGGVFGHIIPTSGICWNSLQLLHASHLSIQVLPQWRTLWHVSSGRA